MTLSLTIIERYYLQELQPFINLFPVLQDNKFQVEHPYPRSVSKKNVYWEGLQIRSNLKRQAGYLNNSGGG